MKVLRIINSMDPAGGGPCQGIRNSIPELRKLGVDNEVVSLDDPCAPFLGKDDFTIHALGPAKTPWSYSNRLLPWLENNLHRFDAVIAHGIWLYASHAAGKAVKSFRNKNKPGKKPAFFVMPHGMLDPYFQKAENRKLKALRNRIYWKMVESRVINDADGVLFTCQAELELARIPFKPYHPKAELNVGYGIPGPGAFKEAFKIAFEEKCPPVRNRSYILFLSRIHDKKGIDILIEAYRDYFRKINKGFPALVIAGPGLDTAFGRQLQDLVQKDRLLNENVFFTGMLSGDSKWGALYGCEAFILPSHQENFGIAVVEALACGKPVLISNQVNIWKEILREGGGLVAPDNLEGVSRLFHQWVSLTDAEKQLMSSGALQAYQKYFSIEPAALKLKQTLEAN